MKVKLDPNKVHLYHEAEDFRPEVEYTVLEIEGNCYRLLPDNIGGPYRYPIDLFIVTDPTPTLGWGATSAPDEFSAPGFYEDYFDNKRSAINTFNAYLERLGIQPERIVLDNGKMKYPYRVDPPIAGTLTQKVKIKSDLPDGLIKPGYFLPDKEYIVLGTEDDFYYLLPENGDPEFFFKQFFELTQSVSNQEWVVIYPSYRNEAGQRIQKERTCPRGLNTLSFWKKYINNDVDTVKAFNLYYGPLGVPIYRIVQDDSTVIKLDEPVFLNV